ncbi:MAG: substrate-binding domain-containing protein [Pseudomonadota bacterium]
MSTKLVALTAAAAIGLVSAAGSAIARDQVKVAGSSTVFPYANIVAEELGRTFDTFKAPIVESVGSSAGLKLFCRGSGPNTIDIANTSRKIREEEVTDCAENGVKNIIEIRFGYDGIVFATDIKGPSFEITPRDVYRALAAKVPIDGKMVDNPNKTWKQVNSALPDWDIVAYIPGENHGTREVFEDKLLEVGCGEAGATEIMTKGGMDTAAVRKACIAVRKDGGTFEIDGDYTETLGRMQANKTGVGVFGLSYYENNTDRLRVATINGVTPSVETISTGSYPVSRPLYFYLKKDHIGTIPGLKEYLELFTSAKMIGPDGPLAAYGLVPMPKAEHDALLAKVKAQKAM